MNDETGDIQEVLSDISGENESCYSTKEVFEYKDNEKGNALENNEGFDIRPLDAEIFGEKAAKESRRKHNIKKQ